MDRKQGFVYGVATVCALTLAVAATSLAGPGGGAGGGPVSFDAEAGPLGDVLSALQFGGLPSVGVLEPLLFVPGLVVFGVVSVSTVRYFDVRSAAGAAVAAVVAIAVGLLAFAVFPRAVPDAPFDGSAAGADDLLEAAERAPASGADVVLHLTPIVGLVALVGTVLVWDLGENAIAVSEQLDAESTTRRGQLLHAAVSAGTVTGFATAVTAVYRVSTGGYPLLAVTLLAVGALIVLVGLGR